MHDMDVDQVVEVPDTPDRLAFLNINGIDRASDISGDGWRNKNKRATRTKIRSMSIPPQSITGIDCASDISDDGWRNINKQATRTKSRSMFVPPCSGSDKSELQGNIRKIASRTTSPSRSAFYSKGNAVDDTFNHSGKSNIQSKYMGKRQANSSSQFQMPACQGHSNEIDLTKHDGHSNICQNYVAGSSQVEQHRKEMVDKSFSPLLIANDPDTGELYEKPRISHRTRKFVKNECISQLNIAKAKQSAQKQNNTFLHSQDDSGTSRDLMGKNKDSRRRKGKEILTDNTLSEEFDEKRNPLSGRDLMGKNKDSRRRKGKEILTDNTLSEEFDEKRNPLSGRDLMGKTKNSRRRKGKEILTDNTLSEEFDEKRNPLSGRTLAGKSDGIAPANEEPCVHSEEANGWISTRKRTKKSNPYLSDEEQLCRREDDPCNVTKLPRNVVVRRDNEDGSNARKHSVSSHNVSVPPISQTLSQKRQDCLLNEHRGSSNTAGKRQKHRSSGTHHCGSSSSPIGNSELLDFGSSGEPSNVRSVRTQNSRTASSFNRFFDIDDFSLERSNGSHNIDCSRNSESDVRVLQVEEDEILAMELQELLYNQSNVAADREIDEQIALELQQGSFQHTFPSGSHHESHPTSSFMSNLHRQNLSQSSQNSSTHRVTQAQVPAATRVPRPSRRFPEEPPTISSRQRNSLYPPSMGVGMTSSFMSNLHRQNLSQSSQNSSTHRATQAQVPAATRVPRPRRRFPEEPRTISSRQRNSLYPPSMGVGMRMHFLEALESVNNIELASGLLGFERDFNENDYEMLLALDENNHQHCGASAAQINGLPESTVQTDNLEECSVCLEIPSIGDTMRHLPCLHRFHKDCIDEWLRRRTSCPICKSSIT